MEQSEESKHKAPGNFRNDGSWDAEADRLPGGTKMLDAVQELIAARRRFPEMLPKEIVGLIQSKRVESGFPSLGQWAECPNWLEAQVRTSAERTVQVAGGKFVPSPIGVIPEITPEIAGIIHAYTGQEVTK